MRRRFLNNIKSISSDSEYFTIEALEDGLTAKLSTKSCEYRIDDGSWNTLSASSNTASINKGQTLSFRGSLTPTSSSGIGTFTISKKCNLKGNIMSLLYSDDFEGQNDLTRKTYAFYKLFYNCKTIVNASEFILPATKLANNCYYNMFYGCTNLSTAPELPATTLTEGCYCQMFYGCSGLTVAPALPATTLAEWCYEYMFKGCTSLTTAPELHATTLAEWCYNNMFNGCTNLTIAPELPATTLADSCYSNMFINCKNLTTAPELLATTLASGCYEYMFYSCSKLSNITMLATDISANNCLSNWVNGVASTGTFVKHKDMTSLTTGTSGIPNGWTVEDYV